MEITFKLEERKFKTEDGRELKYYVLTRELIDGSKIEVAIKGDKSRLLLLSLGIEKQQNSK